FRLVSNEWNGETYEEISLPVEVTEVVPGQYKIKADISSLGEYPYVVLKSSDPSLSFVGEYGPGRLRNFELSIYPQACNFQVMFNGNKKEAAVDFLRPNIDGKMIVDTTFVAGEDTTIVYVNGGNYYLRARETDETIPTYYPDVANWNDAQMITVPTFTEDWYDSIFVVNLQPKPVPLTGTGVIEGKVTHEPETVSFARRWMKLSTAENENVNVLLYGADGNLTATTTVSDEGVYRFENLPFGTYSVVVDAAGYVIESNPNITISADNPTADNIDYTITNDGKVVRDGAGDALPGDANDDKVIDVADITTIAAYILGKTPETFNAANADANQDGSIDVSDITATAGIILAPAPSYQSVDLGLTSGVKWATFNVGASKPEEIGDFYAWGETKTKSEYTWENYPYAEGGIGPEISGTDNDVAHVKWGGSWRLPTNDEIYELTMECDWETTQINGVSGYLVKSQKNGNSIFLPLAGKNFYGIENPGENGYYRSGTGGSGFSYVIYISPFGAVCMHDAGAAGYSVRPVCK
ncbi:MAG: carboxypeptidase regulatory-like domain-containing protein, partial [Prevotellaceae bacterium]|nr:carboxypeptidase regulatory-like domain-containing protein [Prevotellaceae bacterium]